MNLEHKLFYRSDEWELLRKKAFRTHGKICMCCGVMENLQVDHIFPRSKFVHLQNDFSNLQILCKTCNREKSNTHYTDYRTEEQKKIAALIAKKKIGESKKKIKAPKRKRHHDRMMMEILALKDKAVLIRSGRYRIMNKFDVCTYTKKIIFLESGRSSIFYEIGIIKKLLVKASV